MIEITIPNNNQAERIYTINLLFGEFLGVEYIIREKDEDSCHEIVLNNGNKISFKDQFFNKYPKPLSYLSHNNLPGTILFDYKSTNPFINEIDLPIIFGNSNLTFTSTQINCSIDIFASSFFMLTRWEEYANKVRDHFNRFPGKESIASKNNFLHRPVVNEYVEMLWNMLTYLGIDQKRKKRKYRAIVTHDVDSAILWRNPFIFLKKLGGDLIKRKSWVDATNSTSSYSNYILGKTKDPYNTFDDLMDISETNGLRSHFYFLCGGGHKEDMALPLSHPFVKGLLKKIIERGHIIGFHPSFNSYNNPEIFEQELFELKIAVNQPIEYGRQHFLQFENPTTWNLWENAGLRFDSTMNYADAPGFRCGTCYEFPVFNILERKGLQLREMPLTAMEVTWTVYKKSSPIDMFEEIKSLIETCKKYNGDFVLLWHNSSFYGGKEQDLKYTYESIVSFAASNAFSI